MHVLKWVLIVVAILVAGLAAAACWFIGPRNLIGMALYDQRKEGDLKVGDRAPDVALVSLDGSSAVHLKDSIGERPLILIFGSYT